MLSSKPVSTVFVVGTYLIANNGIVLVNAIMYRQVIGELQHLRMTRSNISFPMN